MANYLIQFKIGGKNINSVKKVITDTIHNLANEYGPNLSLSQRLQLDNIIPTIEKIEQRKSRSTRLAEARIKIEEAQVEIENLALELVEWKENLPESLQDGDKAENLEEASQQLGEAYDALDDVNGTIDDVVFPGMYS